MCTWRGEYWWCGTRLLDLFVWPRLVRQNNTRKTEMSKIHPLLALLKSIYTQRCIHVLFSHPAFAHHLSPLRSTSLTPSFPTISPAPLVASVSLKYHPLPRVMNSSWKASLGNLRLWLLHQYFLCCWWLWHVRVSDTLVTGAEAKGVCACWSSFSSSALGTGISTCL